MNGPSRSFLLAIAHLKAQVREESRERVTCGDERKLRVGLLLFGEDGFEEGGFPRLKRRRSALTVVA